MARTTDIESKIAQNFSEALSDTAERHEDALAFRFLHDGEGRADELTYGVLNRRARAVACRLSEHTEPGDRVLVLCPPGLDYIVSLFACMHAGVVSVPAFPPRSLHRAAERLNGILASAQTSVALTTAAARQLVPKSDDPNEPLAKLTWLTADRTDADESDASAWSAPTLRGEDTAILQYTSGSTSDPRGVMLTHQNLLTNAADIAKRMQASDKHTVVSWLPPYHDMGLIGCLLTPVLIAARTILMSPLSFLSRPARWLEAISKHEAHISGGPDFAYSLCARKVTDEECATLSLESWRVAFNGAERVHPRTLREFLARFEPCGFSPAAMRPCYGLAEATLCVSVSGSSNAPRPRRFDADALKNDVVRQAVGEDRAVELVPCGPPMPGNRIRIVEPGPGRALSTDRVGEIWVSGPTVGKGYYGQPDVSASTFRAQLLLSDGHRYLRTGDLGFLHDGELFVVARLKDLIIIRGRNYYPDDIERAAGHAHEGLRLGGTVALQVETADEGRLVVVQELRAEDSVAHDVAAAAIREAVARQFQLPIHAVVLTPPRAIPRTSSGKIQRQQTRELYLAGTLEGAQTHLLGSGAYPRATGQFPQASDDLELKVQRTMARNLGLRVVQLDEDFFALGGQSLIATRVMSELRETLGVDLPLRLIFDAPTPRRLASGIRSVQRHLSVPTIETIPRDGPLPLSYSQERMLFVHLLDPQSAAYNIGGAMQLDGPIDIASIEGAVMDLLDRHEILRASYRLTSEGVVQQLRPRTAPDIQRIDFSGTADPAGDSVRAAGDFAARPFDLQADDLVRVAIHRLGPQSHRLVLCVHHIVADGWSLDVALQDFIAMYLARRAGERPNLAPIESHYVDYAAWQREFLNSAQINDQLRYWTDRLAGAPTFLPLPTDRPRPPRQGHDGGLVQVAMPSELVEQLTTLGREQGATLFMVILAALNVLLSRYSGQLDICVGTPIANRNWRASEGLIGTFVNTLVMRTESAGDPTFLELIARVREVCLGAYDNQDVPFERLVEALHPGRDLSHSPLFQVFLDFQNIRFPETPAADLRFAPVPVERRASQFDMSFGFLDFGGGMLASVEFRTDIFDRSTIERMALHLMQLLRSGIADPASRVSRMRMLDTAERHAVVIAPNETAATNHGFRHIHDVIGTVEPSRVAVTQGAEALCYGELQRRKNQLANHLQGLGVGPDVCVGVLLERTPTLLVALLGVLAAGGAYIPMDPAYPAARLEMMVEDGAPAVIVTERALVGRLSELDVPVVVLDGEDADALSKRPESPPPTPGLNPESLAYVIFTSGSTGRPKGVMVPHRALTNFLHSMAEEPGCGPDDRLLAVTTVSFDIAGLELMLPLAVGATIDLASRELSVDALQLAEHLRSTRPTMMQATPATWRMLIEAGWEGVQGVRILCGGEALPRDLAMQLLDRAAEVWNMYGPTETTIWSAVHRVTRAEGAVPIGRPIRNTELYVFDGNGGLAPLGATGELYIGGAGVAHGYIGRPDLTSERFVPDPFDQTQTGRLYRTGDAVRRGTDGVLNYEGRLDRQIKLRGFRIELEEIEARLRTHPAVADAAARLFEQAAGDARLVAYIVARGQAPDAAALRSHVAEELPDYMVPTGFCVLEEFPRTANGKLDRAALPDPKAAETKAAGDAEPPTTPLERELVQMWQEVLGVPAVGVTDDFFEVGGHSLLAVRLFVRIAEQTGVTLPIGVLFEAATIRALAERIEEGGARTRARSRAGDE